MMMALVVLGSAAIADDKVRDESKPVKLEWSLGAGFIASPRPYVGADPQTLVVPVVNVQYGRWFVEGIRGGVELVDGGAWRARALTQVQFQGLEPESSPFLDGLEPRSTSLDGGIEVLYRGRPVGFRFEALSDLLDRSGGQEVSLAVTSGAPLGKALLLVGVGPRWRSSRRVDYYFGVDPAEARPERPAYRGRSTIGWDVAVSTFVDLTERWRLFAVFNREGLGAGIEDSPLVDRTSAYSFVSVVSVRF